MEKVVHKYSCGEVSMESVPKSMKSFAGFSLFIRDPVDTVPRVLDARYLYFLLLRWIPRHVRFYRQTVDDQGFSLSKFIRRINSTLSVYFWNDRNGLDLVQDPWIPISWNVQRRINFGPWGAAINPPRRRNCVPTCIRNIRNVLMTLRSS